MEEAEEEGLEGGCIFASECDPGSEEEAALCGESVLEFWKDTEDGEVGDVDGSASAFFEVAAVSDLVIEFAAEGGSAVESIFGDEEEDPVVS